MANRDACDDGETAIHTCVFTAFSDVLKKRLMRKCCLIHLKNKSTLPAHPIEVTDSERRQSHMICNEHEATIVFVAITDALQSLGVPSLRAEDRQLEYLVAKRARPFVDAACVDTLELGVGG